MHLAMPMDGFRGSWFIVDSSLVGYDGSQNVREERWVAREPQTPRDRALLLLRATFLPGWSPTVSQGLVWAIRGALVLGTIVLIASAVDKPLWEWLGLLIVPAVLAIGGYLFNSSQNRATQAAADQRAQDEALQAYLKDMSDMLIPSKDQPSLSDESPPDSLRSVARARTLTMLSRLDGAHKGSVLQFLYEANLIGKKEALDSSIEPREAIVDLSKADLQGVHQSRTSLEGANLGLATLNSADLSGSSLMAANLDTANLKNANLRWSFLIGASLVAADLSVADLRGTSLHRADLTLVDLTQADLREADLREALLINTSLSEADLREADLQGANLRGADGWTEEQFTAAKSLRGATMPDGQKYEEWLKSKGSGMDGENSASS
jgi:uncharacterized protein YjbI with pentapeptide repeats